MKILQLGKFYPPDVGGIEQVICDLNVGLNNRGVACDVLCSNSSLSYKEEILPCGSKVMRCPSFGKIASTSISPFMIVKLSKIVLNYDIIHIHFPDPMSNLALRCVSSKIKNKKIIIHWHSDIIKQKFLLKLYLPLQQWLLKRADCIIATSEKYIAESSFLPRFSYKCSCIPIGIDKMEARGSVLRVLESKKILLSIGRFAYNKGFEYLISSAEFLSSEYVVCIIGSGNQAIKKQYDELIALKGLQNRVYILENLQRGVIGAYLQASYIFILPSIQESYGIVLLEAMSFGKPIINTRLSPSGADWINQDGYSGIVISPRDSLGIANAVLNIERDYTKYSTNSYLRYSQYFTKDIMIDKVYKLYDRLATA